MAGLTHRDESPAAGPPDCFVSDEALVHEFVVKDTAYIEVAPMGELVLGPQIARMAQINGKGE